VEPPEKAKPSLKWRLYVFKNGELTGEPLHIHRQSYYLFGRERKVVDVPTDHPSCSKQHAVIQYRERTKWDDDEGADVKVALPYIMDLNSTNGTHLNGDRIEPQRYYELLEKDTIKFGMSTREYVLLNEDSK
jgi:smad nuclear-interacting protein 1